MFRKTSAKSPRKRSDVHEDIYGHVHEQENVELLQDSFATLNFEYFVFLFIRVMTMKRMDSYI
jgi:ribosomal protein L25 (general stress protein Ctc)